MNQPIRWTLKHLRPHQGDLFKTLDVWFSSPVLAERYWDGKNGFNLTYHCHYKGCTAAFTKLDQQNDTKWQAHTARRLLAVQRVVIDKAYELRAAGLDTWMLQNCRPYGGEWTGSVYYKNPTGKQCRSILCPWCWMRQFDSLRLLLATPADSYAELPTGRSARGLGLCSPLHVTSFWCAPNANFDLFRREVAFMDFYRRSYALYREKEEPANALRTLGLAYRDGRLGLQMAFATSSPLPDGRDESEDRESAFKETIYVDHHAELSYEDALRLMLPYPVELLKAQSGTIEILSGFLRGKHAYDRITVAPPASLLRSLSSLSQPSTLPCPTPQ